MLRVYNCPYLCILSSLFSKSRRNDFWRTLGPSLETGAVFDAALSGNYCAIAIAVSVMTAQEKCDEKGLRAGGWPTLALSRTRLPKASRFSKGGHHGPRRLVHSSHTTRQILCYRFRMPNRLHRYYGAGYLHFITTSCYQRRAMLGSRRRARPRAGERTSEGRTAGDKSLLMPSFVVLTLRKPRRVRQPKVWWRKGGAARPLPYKPRRRGPFSGTRSISGGKSLMEPNSRSKNTIPRVTNQIRCRPKLPSVGYH